MLETKEDREARIATYEELEKTRAAVRLAIRKHYEKMITEGRQKYNSQERERKARKKTGL